LGHDRVFACSNQRFDFQVLLYPFKEQLYLPPCLINISDGPG